MAVVEELADEGDEITVDDTHRWSALDPKVGMVLERAREQKGVHQNLQSRRLLQNQD